MAAKQSAPDGYTILVGTSGTLGVNPNIYAAIPYDPLKDFAPASNLFIAPLVLVAHPSFPPSDVRRWSPRRRHGPERSTTPRPAPAPRST